MKMNFRTRAQHCSDQRDPTRCERIGVEEDDRCPLRAGTSGTGIERGEEREAEALRQRREDGGR